jgi:hypothetical protein
VVLRGRKLVLAGGSVVLAVASPLAFTLGPVEVGDAVSASIIAATAAVALALPLWPGRTDGAEPGRDESADVVATGTGMAQAENGGDANTGVQFHRATGGHLRAENTGPAIAQGPGGHANSGVEEIG